VQNTAVRGGGERQVNVRDFDGVYQVKSEEELLARLRSVGRGADGAFILDHGGPASLWVHLHGDAAFLWYWPTGASGDAGFVADQMWPGERREVRFRLVSEFEGDTINVPWWQLVPVETAYRAAVEFLLSPARPPSVVWLAL
jgi:hypothetical protein